MTDEEGNIVVGLCDQRGRSSTTEYPVQKRTGLMGSSSPAARVDSGPESGGEQAE